MASHRFVPRARGIRLFSWQLCWLAAEAGADREQCTLYERTAPFADVPAARGSQGAARWNQL